MEDVVFLKLDVDAVEVIIGELIINNLDVNLLNCYLRIIHEMFHLSQ